MENEINLTIAPTTDGSPRDAQDLLHEGNPRLSAAETRPQTVVDVEHNPVQDDPRCWSSLRKVSDKLQSLSIRERQIGILNPTSEFLLISNFIGCNDLGVGRKHTKS